MLKTIQRIRLSKALLILAARGLCVLAADAAEEFRVPLMTEAPKLDGRIEPGEWAASAGFDGFITLNEDRLQRRRDRDPPLCRHSDATSR